MSENEVCLTEASLKGVANYIKSRGVHNVIVMTGAGVSTAAGIPDFRSPKTGLYANLQKYKLPYPEAIFDIEYFYDRPEPFYILAKEIMPSADTFRPTLSHYFIKLLANNKLLLRNYTQNIDTLERLAGLDEELLVEAHGSFHSARCIGKMSPKRFAAKGSTSFVVSAGDTTSSDDSSSDQSNSEEEDALDNWRSCGRAFTQEWLRDQVFAKELEGKVPQCPDCGGLVKPNITFFGEQLPERFYKLMHHDFERADLLIVMGTSLQVSPFKDLIHLAPPGTPRLLINLEKVAQVPPKVNVPVTRLSQKLKQVLNAPKGFDFDNEYSKVQRDVFYQGSTDDGSKELARHLGWESDLLQLYAQEQSAFKKELQSANREVITESVQDVIEHVRDAIAKTHIANSIDGIE